MTKALQAGDLVGGRYRIVRRLGMGGMGAVYLATVEGMAGFEKQVALKVAHQHLSDDPHAIELFLSEARLSAQLQHPNIGQVYDLGQSDDLYFIAMEYIDGLDLRALITAAGLQGGLFPLPVAVAILCRLLEGLDYAHNIRDKSGKPLKLVHRDVSPANCLISYHGNVKLIDFGIAKAVDQAHRTKTGMVRGKINYMSPEQLQGQPLDRRSDVFAVGVLLYELLVGVRPFDSPRDLELMRNVIAGLFKRPREHDPEIPEELEAVVMKALHVDRTVRFASATELQEPLEAWLLKGQLRVGGRELAAFVAQLAPARAGDASEHTGETGARATPATSPSAALPTQLRVAQTTQVPATQPGPERALVATEPAGPARPSTARSAVATVPDSPSTLPAAPPVVVPASRRPAIAAVAAAVLLVSGVLVWRWSAPAEEPQRAPAPPAVPVVTAEPPPAVAAPVEPEPQPPVPAPPPAARITARTGADRPKPRKEPQAAGSLLLSSYLTVRASSQSEVFVDGVSIGQTPKLRHVLKPGEHALRVDCLYPSGRRQGGEQRIQTPPEQETEVQHQCPN